MAISIKDRYPSKVDTTDAAYPQGKARNITTTLDGLGTPFEKDLVNDIMGLQQAIYKEAGITPSGTPDSADVCQQLDGLKVVQDKRSINDLSQYYTFPTVAAFKSSLIEFPDTKRIYLADRDAYFTKITGQSGDDTNLIPSTNVNQSIDLILEESNDIKAFGATTGGSSADNTPAMQSAGALTANITIDKDYNVNDTITFLNKNVTGGGRLIFDIGDEEDGAIVKCRLFDVKVQKLVPATSIVNIGDSGGKGIVYRGSDCVSNTSDSEGFSNAITVSSSEGAIKVSLLSPRMIALGRGLTIPSGGGTVVSTVNIIGNYTIELGDDGIITLPSTISGLDGILHKWPNILNIQGTGTVSNAIEHGCYMQSTTTMNGDWNYTQVNPDAGGDGFKISNPDLVLGHTATITHTGKMTISGCKTGLLSEFATKNMVFGDVYVDLTQHNAPVDGVRLTNAVDVNADVSEHVSMGNVRIKIGGAARLGFSNKLDGVSTIGDIVVDAIVGASSVSLVDLSPRNNNDSIITEIKSINATADDVGLNPLAVDIGSGNGSGKVHIGNVDSNTSLRVLGNSQDNIVISAGNLKTGLGYITFTKADKAFANADIRPQGLETYPNTSGYTVKRNAIIVGWVINLTENPTLANACLFKIKTNTSVTKTVNIDGADFVDGKLSGTFNLSDRVGFSDGDVITVSFERLTMTFGDTGTPFAITFITM